MAEQTTPQISVIYNSAGLFLTKIHPGWAAVFQMVVVIHCRFSDSFSVTDDKTAKQTPPKYVSGVSVCTFITWTITTFNLSFILS